MTPLYHYTCQHGRSGIGREGWLKLNPQPVLRGLPLIWLTTQSVPVREQLGLTSYSLSCDRLQFRYLIEDPHVIPWHDYRRVIPFGVSELERPPADPTSWYIAVSPIFARLDNTYRLERMDEASA